MQEVTGSTKVGMRRCYELGRLLQRFSTASIRVYVENFMLDVMPPTINDIALTIIQWHITRLTLNPNCPRCLKFLEVYRTRAHTVFFLPRVIRGAHTKTFQRRHAGFGIFVIERVTHFQRYAVAPPRPCGARRTAELIVAHTRGACLTRACAEIRVIAYLKPFADLRTCQASTASNVLAQA